jgi:hypothetical protein
MKSFRHLKNLSNQFSISIPVDEKGMLGRECPNSECLGYFKIEPGTGLIGDNIPFHCPYCGHTGEQNQFHTPAQIEYAKSVVINEFTQALRKDIQTWDRELRRKSRGSFLKLSVQYKGRPHPIHYYAEEDLETEIVCDQCKLHYAIYGVFGFCPDCRTHNTLQILEKNFELVEKQIALSDRTEDQELASYITADALENVIAAFDGFGRELCKIQGSPTNISFQNIVRAKDRVMNLYKIDISSAISADGWEAINRGFQKRHLFAHSMGVVDQEYLSKAKDPNAMEGRKVSLSIEEIRELMHSLRLVATYMATNLSGEAEK